MSAFSQKRTFGPYLPPRLSRLLPSDIVSPLYLVVMAPDTVMDDVAKWLAVLGLSKYAEEFAKNDVGSDVLPQLTEEHLKDLGVSLGDRLRLLEAIDALVASQAKVLRALREESQHLIDTHANHPHHRRLPGARHLLWSVHLRAEEGYD